MRSLFLLFVNIAVSFVFFLLFTYGRTFSYMCIRRYLILDCDRRVTGVLVVVLSGSQVKA